MVGESPRPRNSDHLLDAVLLAVLGLYETIELMEKKDGDEFWVNDRYFTVKIGEKIFDISLDHLIMDFGYQYPWFEFQILVRKKEILSEVDWIFE